MREPTRLSKRLVEILHCTQKEAIQYIEGGWVRVNGVIVEQPQLKVVDDLVELDPQASLDEREPVTILLHKPADFDAGGPTKGELAAELIRADSRWDGDNSGVRMLQRHFMYLTSIFPLATGSSGLMVFTQNPVLVRHLRDRAKRMEQEFVVEVDGNLVEGGLEQLAKGITFDGVSLPPTKVSWQNERHLRFAITAPKPGQISQMCEAVGLEVVAMKRLRIASVPLGKMPAGQWRYLPSGARL